MSPQNQSVVTVKEMTAEVMREKNALVGRLNAMHQLIAEEQDLVIKVRRKVEWAAEKERSVEALNKIVASLRSALDEEERSTHGSFCSRAGSAASRPHRAWKEYRSSSAPPLTLATWPQFRLPARLDTDDGEEPAPMPASKAAGIIRSFSIEASQLPQQVRRSLRNKAWRFSESVLRGVGWNPPLRVRSQRMWDYSI